MITVPKVIDDEQNEHLSGHTYSGPCPFCRDHEITIEPGESVTCACGRTVTATWDDHTFYGEVLHIEAVDVEAENADD